MIFSTYRSIVTAPYHDITRLYFSNGDIKVPTQEELTKVDAEIAAMGLTGKFTIGGASIGLVFSYLVWGIPIVGPVVGFAGGVTSVLSGVTGYDIWTSSKNLHEFAHKKVTNESKHIFYFLSSEKKITQNEFKETLLKTAVKGTLLADPIFKILHANNII